MNNEYKKNRELKLREKIREEVGRKLDALLS